ncbi:hypothetical protein KSP40_PGU013813 [Platanthera guangdongensis]|uniref:Uncharacterized protein n=1 Tax=Platanthera guangdongensis TaxID=2320717 RepID=A0ABR2MN38_9ASPA
MDNDDLRRGQSSYHMAYGKPLAVLAGDALNFHSDHHLADMDNYPSSGVSPTLVLRRGQPSCHRALLECSVLIGSIIDDGSNR